jgi:hypothetical protein
MLSKVCECEVRKFLVSTGFNIKLVLQAVVSCGKVSLCPCLESVSVCCEE